MVFAYFLLLFGTFDTPLLSSEQGPWNNAPLIIGPELLKTHDPTNILRYVTINPVPVHPNENYMSLVRVCDELYTTYKYLFGNSQKEIASLLTERLGEIRQHYTANKPYKIYTAIIQNLLIHGPTDYIIALIVNPVLRPFVPNAKEIPFEDLKNFCKCIQAFDMAKLGFFDRQMVRKLFKSYADYLKDSIKILNSMPKQSVSESPNYISNVQYQAPTPSAPPCNPAYE